MSPSYAVPNHILFKSSARYPWRVIEMRHMGRRNPHILPKITGSHPMSRLHADTHSGLKRDIEPGCRSVVKPQMHPLPTGATSAKGAGHNADCYSRSVYAVSWYPAWASGAAQGQKHVKVRVWLRQPGPGILWRTWTQGSTVLQTDSLYIGSHRWWLSGGRPARRFTPLQC